MPHLRLLDRITGPVWRARLSAGAEEAPRPFKARPVPGRGREPLAGPSTENVPC